MGQKPGTLGTHRYPKTVGEWVRVHLPQNMAIIGLYRIYITIITHPHISPYR